MFVIQNKLTNMYAAEPGQLKSYVRDVHSARRFNTDQEAIAQCCGNERVVPYRPVMAGRPTHRPILADAVLKKLQEAGEHHSAMLVERAIKDLTK